MASKLEEAQVLSGLQNLPGWALAGGRVDGQAAVARLRPAWQLSFEQQMASLPVSVFVTGGKTNRWIPLNEVNTFLRPPVLLGPPFLATGFTPPARSLDFEDFRSVETGLRFRHRLGAAARRACGAALLVDGRGGLPVRRRGDHLAVLGAASGQHRTPRGFDLGHDERNVPKANPVRGRCGVRRIPLVGKYLQRWPVVAVARQTQMHTP